MSSAVTEVKELDLTTLVPGSYRLEHVRPGQPMMRFFLAHPQSGTVIRYAEIDQAPGPITLWGSTPEPLHLPDLGETPPQTLRFRHGEFMLCRDSDGTWFAWGPVEHILHEVH